jgi:hypothetical protein
MFDLTSKVNLCLAWLRSLFHAVDQPPATEASLNVPEGCLALCLRDRTPEEWLGPGVHRIRCAREKVEVRLIASSVLARQDRTRFGQALGLPYKRALLFSDGQHIATMLPGHSARRPSCAGPEPLPAGRPVPVRGPAEPCGEREDGLVEDYTFV